MQQRSRKNRPDLLMVLALVIMTGVILTELVTPGTAPAGGHAPLQLSQQSQTLPR